MGRKLSVFALGLMVLAVGLLANPARAAVPGRGVVIAVDAARMSGIIIVTTLGDAVHPHPTLGEEVPFLAAPEPLAVGDLVEFDYDPTGVVAIPLKKISSGVVITGLHDGKVEATAATPMLITGATISGKITVNGGILVIIGSSVVDGRSTSTMGPPSSSSRPGVLRPRSTARSIASPRTSSSSVGRRSRGRSPPIRTTMSTSRTPSSEASSNSSRSRRTAATYRTTRSPGK